MVFCFLLISITSFSQDDRTALTNLSMEGRNVMNMGNLLGRPFLVDPYREIKGTAYFTDTFCNSSITLRGGKTYSGLKFRFNHFTNELHYRQGDSVEMIAGKEVIQRITFHQQINNQVRSTSFSNGYPFVDNNDGLTYYEEICTGKAMLLKITFKVLAKEQGLTATPLDKKFVNNYSYYVFANKKLERWRKGEEFILFMLADQEENIKAYIKSQNIKCKNQDDAQKIVSYYNTL